MAATVLNESTVPFLAPNADNTRLQVVLDNNGVKFPRLEDSSGNVLANYSATTGSWLPLDANYTIGDTPINNYLKDKNNIKTLNNVTKNSIKNLTTEEQQTYEDLNNYPFNTNEDMTPQAEPLTAADLGGGSVSVPKDPEGFFIGRYPINQKETDDFDFLKITCYDYEPGLFSGGDQFFKIDDMDKRVKKRKGVVSLPMQPGISETNNVNWSGGQINPIQIAGAGLAGAAMDELSTLGTGGSGKNIFNSLGATAKAALGDVNKDLIKSYFAGQAIGADLLGRGTGLTINNNLEVLFNGPELRTFSYDYRFTPREPKEADKIKQIIRFFKKTMAPKRSNSRIFLKSPDVFKLKYTFKNGDSHPFLNNIKICALSSFSVDYTPDGSYSTYEDDGGRGDGSMTSYRVSLGFKELTPIYNDDYWNDDEGKEGTGF